MLCAGIVRHFLERAVFLSFRANFAQNRVYRKFRTLAAGRPTSRRTSSNFSGTRGRRWTSRERACPRVHPSCRIGRSEDQSDTPIDRLGTHAGTGEESLVTCKLTSGGPGLQTGLQLFWTGTLFLRFRRTVGRYRRKGAAEEEGTLRRTVDGSRQLAQRSTAVGKSAHQCAADWGCERYHCLGFSERQ